MRKKLTVLALALITVFALVACGNKAEEKFGDYTSSDIQNVLQSTAEQLEGLSADEAKQYAEYYASQKDDDSAAMYSEMFKNWSEYRDQAGDFKGYGKFEVAKSGKTVTAKQVLNYSKRDMRIIYVMKAKDMEVSAINVELVYTLGETMQKAGLNTLMGLGTVFVMLVLISLIISCFRFIPVLQEKFSGKGNATEKKAEVKASAPAPAATQNLTDDLELVAVIAAAIAASTGTTTDDFVVRSIKRRY